MKKVIKYFAQILQDQNGRTSSKRIIGMIALYYLYMIVHEEVSNPDYDVDFNLLLIIAGLILISIGAITSEFFKNMMK